MSAPGNAGDATRGANRCGVPAKLGDLPGRTVFPQVKPVGSRTATAELVDEARLVPREGLAGLGRKAPLQKSFVAAHQLV